MHADNGAGVVVYEKTVESGAVANRAVNTTSSCSLKSGESWTSPAITPHRHAPFPRVESPLPRRTHRPERVDDSTEAFSLKRHAFSPGFRDSAVEKRRQDTMGHSNDNVEAAQGEAPKHVKQGDEAAAEQPVPPYQDADEGLMGDEQAAVIDYKTLSWWCVGDVPFILRSQS